MKLKLDHCRGCLVKCICFYKYAAGYIAKVIILNCPCNTCLVKMTCNSELGCEEYATFSENTKGRVPYKIYKGWRVKQQ